MRLVAQEITRRLAGTFLRDASGRLEAKDLELEREQIVDRLVREQVGGEQAGRN
jgi:hypothetical protein